MEIIVDGIEYIAVIQIPSDDGCNGCAADNDGLLCVRLPMCSSPESDRIIFIEKPTSK